MSLATCVRFCGPHSFAELNALEQRVTCIDPDVYFLSTSPITSYKDDPEFRTEVEGLLQFSKATLRERAVISLQDAPIGPGNADLKLLQADGKPLTPSVAAHRSCLISPLPNGTSKAVLLDVVRGHGATGDVSIFQHIGGLVRFPTAEAAKAARERAARLQLLVLGENVKLRAVDERKLFCMELLPEVTEDQLRTLFEQHGVVTHVLMHPEKRYRGRHCRDALITFDSPRSTTAALRANNGKIFRGRPLRLPFGDINGKISFDRQSSTNPSNADVAKDTPTPTPAPSELETLFISELQCRLLWQQRAADYADWYSQAQADVGKALAEMQEIEVTFEAERRAFELERTQWATQHAQLVDDCVQLRSECANLRSNCAQLQDEREQLIGERDEALHRLDVAESRRKMLEMDLESAREKERALRDALAEQERRHGEEARAAKDEQDRLAREAGEQRRKGEEDTRRAQANRRADDTKRRAEEAEQRRRAEKEEAQRRAKEEEGRRRAEEAKQERQARRRAAAAAEEERCLLRDARWPHRWPFSSFTPMNARDRFLTVSHEFDSLTHPFSDSHPLVARSVPWPTLAHPAAFDLASLTWDMVERFTKAMKGIMAADEYRTFLKNTRLRFHPDKWAARRILQAVVDDEMRAQMEAACKTVSQAINDAVREMGGC
ncbi:hypothetical protein GGG16DRAFT_115282 [Schizophyllum commune]